MHLQSPPLTINGTALKESDDLAILGVTFDSKMTFEKHLRSVSSAASQRLGILRKSWRVFHDGALLGRCFRGFVLPVLSWNDLASFVFDGVGLAGFKSRANASLLAQAALSLL